MLAGWLRTKVSAYVDDVTVFVSCRLEITAVQQMLAKQERVTGAKINS